MDFVQLVVYNIFIQLFNGFLNRYIWVTSPKLHCPSHSHTLPPSHLFKNQQNFDMKWKLYLFLSGLFPWKYAIHYDKVDTNWKKEKNI